MRAAGSHSEAEWQRLLDTFGQRCAYCGVTGIRLTRDHIIPLIRGGTHDIGNIVPACAPCNQRKGRMTAVEYLARLSS